MHKLRFVSGSQYAVIVVAVRHPSTFPTDSATVASKGICYSQDERYPGKDLETHSRWRWLFICLWVSWSSQQTCLCRPICVVQSTTNPNWGIRKCHGKLWWCYMFACWRDARNMARDVHSILLELVKEKGGMDDDAANAYIKKMQSRGRYLQDVWS